MAHQATSRPSPSAAGAALARRSVGRLRRSRGLAAAWPVFAATRAGIAVVAIIAGLTFAGPGDPIGDLSDGSANAAKYDVPGLTQPFGEVGDALLSPLARWDAAWYLEIARSGYEGVGAGEAGPGAAYFPLYPGLVSALAAPFGSSPGELLIAAYLISLAAFLGALVLLYKLVELDFGARVARASVLLLALFPASLFFGAPYAESLFLLVSVGAFYAARTEHWAWAGALAACASATRSAGLLLLVPLALLYLYGPRGEGGDGGERRAAPTGLGRLRPRHRPGWSAAWLLLAPLGLAAYATYLGAAHGQPFAFVDAQDAWLRDFAGPFVGVWDALVAAFEGARQLLSGAREPVFFEQAGGDPFRVARDNLVLLGFLVFAGLATAGALRRLPVAYGAWALVALALPLSFPVGPQPLMSLPRFLAVLFPLFVWLALVSVERRAVRVVAALSALGLAVFTAQFATWHWIS